MKRTPFICLVGRLAAEAADPLAIGQNSFQKRPARRHQTSKPAVTSGRTARRPAVGIDGVQPRA